MWVRTASKRDLPTVRELLVTTWHATYDPLYGVAKVNEITGEWHSLSALEAQLEVPNSEFVVADDGKNIAGMAYAQRISDNKAKLQQLYVLPDCHGRGVGKLLLEEIEDSFFESASLMLEVEEQNTGAIRFYQKHGYSQTGRVENCGTGNSGIPALVFSKPLG